MIAIQAYGFTNFGKQSTAVHQDSIAKTTMDKAKAIFLGVDIPKTITKKYPRIPYERVNIPFKENDNINAWILRTDSISKGMVVIFHGFLEEKSSKLYYGYNIMNMGYDIVLVDFLGAGESSGYQSTIGYNEAENVKAVYDYLSENNYTDNMYLLGFSMGAVAIIKAQHDYNMDVNGLILEAPYGTLEGTIGARLDLVGAPRTIFEQLITFWVGRVNDFDGFALRPQDYAKDIKVPVLLMVGEHDQYVSLDEIQLIHDNLATDNKILSIMSKSKHENYLRKNTREWRIQVRRFLKSN